MTNEPVEVELEREDEDDHDLLTYGEAGVRLQQEVFKQRKRVAELEKSANPALETERKRLVSLEEALDRNKRQPINDDNFEKFFGYKGTAQRNT